MQETWIQSLGQVSQMWDLDFNAPPPNSLWHPCHSTSIHKRELAMSAAPSLHSPDPAFLQKKGHVILKAKLPLGSLETVGINPTCKVPWHLRPGDLGWASPSSSFTFCSSVSLVAHLLWYIHHVAFCYFYHMDFHHLLYVSADDFALCKVRSGLLLDNLFFFFLLPSPSLPMWFLKAGKTEIVPI